MWFCVPCSRWHPSSTDWCPYCGASAKGRVCRRCREKVGNDALFCAKCGSSELAKPAPGKPRLPVRRRALLAVGAVALVLAGATVLKPLLCAAVRTALQASWTAAVYAGAFWVLSGMLPDPARKAVRGAAAWSLRQLFRAVRGLLP